MYYNVESINLKSKYETEEVKKFLEGFNLKYEDVDYTVVIRENDEVIATAEYTNDPKRITNITNIKVNNKDYHNFAITKLDINDKYDVEQYENIIDVAAINFPEDWQSHLVILGNDC